MHPRQRLWQGPAVCLSATQPDALVGCQQGGGSDLFGQLKHAQGIACGDGAHAHLVLVMAFGGAREHTGRHRVFQRFGGPGAGANLHRLETMVEHRSLFAGARQVTWQPMVVAHVHQQGELAVEQVGDVGYQCLEAVHGEGDMATVEVPAMQYPFGLSVDDRVVVGAIEFGFDEAAQPAQAVGQHAEHMGGTA
ncbi:hypothetical protein D9M71_448970 [compost metagenome]